MSEPVLVARDDGVATVTLNGPEKRNAVNRAMWRCLRDAMRALSAQDDVRCIVVRGAGDNAFSAGADVSEFAVERAGSASAKGYGSLVGDTLQSIAGCRHPTVAMIRGACIGEGLEIASMCDLRVCGESSLFGVPAGRLGLTVSYGELRGLLAVAGRATTLELLLEGRIFGAGEALRKRLVNRVVPDDQVEQETRACAARIAGGAPLVARWHKQFIDRLTVAAKLTEADWKACYACFDTADYRLGVEAFLNGTPPHFNGT